MFLLSQKGLKLIEWFYVFFLIFKKSSVVQTNDIISLKDISIDITINYNFYNSNRTKSKFGLSWGFF
jgi:hypothetical protein